MRETAPRATISEVEVDGLSTALGPLHRDDVLLEVECPKPAQHQRRMRAHHPHGHDHVARLLRPRGRLRQERGVEHEVVRIDERDVEVAAVAPEQAGDVAAGESGADDHVPSHGWSIGRHLRAPRWPGYATRRAGPSSEPSVYAWQTRSGWPWAARSPPWAHRRLDLRGRLHRLVLVAGALIRRLLRRRHRPGGAQPPQRPRRPNRLVDASQPVTPAGLPVPFVYRGVRRPRRRHVVFGAVIGGGRGVIWVFSGIVLVLVGGVGLAFWGATMVARRTPPVGGDRAAAGCSTETVGGRRAPAAPRRLVAAQGQARGRRGRRTAAPREVLEEVGRRPDRT